MTVKGETKCILCFLEAKTFKFLHYDIWAHHNYLNSFWIFIYLQHIHFIAMWVTDMTDYLSGSLST